MSHIPKKEYYQKKLEVKEDAMDRVVLHPTPAQVKAAKKIFIVAICGKAMASLAQLLVDAGYEVSGSDTAFFPPMGDLLRDRGIKTHEGYDEKHIIEDKPDIVVIGNSMGPTNVETKYCRENNIPQLSVAEALQYFIFKDRKVLVVAGTHGKTTTTGLLVHTLKQYGLNPGYLIGGVDKHTEKSAELGDGEYFVIEGDEYDTSYFDKSPKFLSYKAHSAILTSVEMDHVDIYDGFEDYKQAFQYLVEHLPSDGSLVYCSDHESVRDVAKLAHHNTYSYGTKKEFNPTFYLEGTHQETKDGHFVNYGKVIEKDKGEITIESNLSGTYNMLNFTAVYGLCTALGLDQNKVLECMSSYDGMKRRQEVIFNGKAFGGQKFITVVDDYAHHPTAVIETLKGLREKFGTRRFIVAFEFGSNSSTKRVFEEMYVTAFSNADLIRLRIIPHKEDVGGIYLRPEVLAENINKGRGTEVAKSFENTDELLQDILNQTNNNDVIIIMASYAFDGIQKKIQEALR